MMGRIEDLINILRRITLVVRVFPFIYTALYLRRAVVLIGPTTSASEFLNSFSHEVRHLADAIALSIGVDLHSETPAYLTGDAVMALAEVVCRFGCEHCRKKG